MSTAVPAASPAAIRLNRKVIGITIGAALGGFLFGFDSSVINGAVDSIQGHFGLTDAATGFTVASALLGCAVGAWFAGSLSNRWGRIRVMVIASILFFVSAIGSGLAFSVGDLILWRLVGGLAVGAASVIAPAYIAEVAPAVFRGRLGSLQQLAIVTGIFTALLTAQLFATTAGGASQDLWLGLEAWRWMFMAEAIPAVIYGVIAMRLPESPRYLVGKHRDEEAAAVLKSVEEDDVEGKIAEIRASLGADDSRSYQHLRGSSFGLKPIVWTGIILAVLQQLVGINVIFYYSTTLWQSVGFSESDAFLTSTITSLTNIAVTIVAIMLVDRIGRRKLMLIGSVGMFVMLALMSLAFSHATLDANENAVLAGHWATTALIGANGFVVFFGATWGPVVWVLLGEMFPNRIRATALSIAAAAQWLANFAVTITFPSLSTFSLSFAYGIYAFMALVSFFFVLRRVRETKGIELEDMPDTSTVERVSQHI